MMDNKYQIELGRETEQELLAIAKMVSVASQVIDDGGKELRDAALAIAERAWHELGKWIEREGK